MKKDPGIVKKKAAKLAAVLSQFLPNNRFAVAVIGQEIWVSFNSDVMQRGVTYLENLSLDIEAIDDKLRITNICEI